MGPGSSRALQAEPLRPASVLLADPAWHQFVPRAEATARRAARAAGCTATILLADDRTVRRLNARDRGQDKPTNVLTYDPPAPGLPGQIVLALGVLRREAAAAHRRPSHHLAHLIVHAALHLAGLDHQQAGAARQMEMAEARILGRIGVPNPWKQGQGALPPGPPPRARPWNPSVGSVRVGGVAERVGGRGGAAQPGGTERQSASFPRLRRPASPAHALRDTPHTHGTNGRVPRDEFPGGGPGSSAPWPCFHASRIPRFPPR